MAVVGRTTISCGVSAAEEARPLGISVEAVLYVLLGIAAFLMRVWALDGWPLRPAEAAQAWGAWNLAQGAPIGVSEYSPLLMTGNWIIFSLLRASDAAARWWPALFGLALAMTPALLRQRLGRTGALLAALLLTFSPSVLAASRLLDGRIVALFAGVLLVAALTRLADGGGRGNVLLSTVALGLGLLSAPMFYAIVLIVLTGGLLLWLLQKPLGIGQTVAGLRSAWATLRGETGIWRTAGIVLVALLALLGTALAFNLQGLGVAAGLLPAWIASFARSATSLGPLTSLWALALYEALLVIFGIAGLVVGIRRRDALALLLGWWALVGLVLGLVSGGWQPADLALTAVPLALLAGRFLGLLVESVVGEPLGEGEWLLIGIVTPLSVYSFVELAVFARAGRSLYMLALGGSALIFVIVAGLMVFWMGWRRTLRGVAGGVLLLCAAVFVSNAWSANYNFDGSRRDLFSAERIDQDARDLVGQIQRYSNQNLRDANAAPLLVVGDELTWLHWALRDFRDVSFVRAFESADQRPVALSPAGVEPPLGDLFTGTDFQVRSAWRFSHPTGQELAKWLLYRDPVTAPQRQGIIMWVQKPAQTE